MRDADQAAEETVAPVREPSTIRRWLRESLRELSLTAPVVLFAVVAIALIAFFLDRRAVGLRFMPPTLYLWSGLLTALVFSTSAWFSLYARPTPVRLLGALGAAWGAATASDFAMGRDEVPRNQLGAMLTIGLVVWVAATLAALLLRRIRGWVIESEHSSQAASHRKPRTIRGIMSLTVMAATALALVSYFGLPDRIEILPVAMVAAIGILIALGALATVSRMSLAKCWLLLGLVLVAAVVAYAPLMMLEENRAARGNAFLRVNATWIAPWLIGLCGAVFFGLLSATWLRWRGLLIPNRREARLCRTANQQLTAARLS